MFVSTRARSRPRTGRISRIGISGGILAGSCLIALAASPAGAVDPIQLNEVLADPARDWNHDSVVSSRDDEWVEIVNTGIVTVNLEGYRLASADSIWRHGFTGLLFPGEVRVVYGGESLAWEQANGFPQFGLRLANTGGEIMLWKLTDQDTVLADSYTYADHEAEDDRSSGRVPDGGPAWTLFDALNPYGGSAVPPGSGCTPSPGGPFQCPVPVKSETWGGLKTRYLPPWS